MKSFICVLAVGFLAAGGAAAQDVAKERRVRTAADLHLPMVTHFSPDGTVRTFNSAQERDRVLAQEAKDREVREQNMRRYEDAHRAQQERRADDAGWKLGAIGLGLFLGLLGAIFGRR
jgi:hypothetical protein